MKKLAKILFVLLLLAVLAGCGSTKQQEMPKAEAPASDAAITVTDMMGRTVTLDEPADKIVVLTAGDCEILYALGAGDRLVGRGEYCDYPQQVLEVPMVASGSETNLEQILTLAPQVVVMGDMDQTKEQVDALENAGIKVIMSDAHNIAGTYDCIRNLGIILGKDAEAEALIADMEATFDEIRQKAGDGSKTVYFEVSPLQYGLWTAAGNTFMDEIAQMLGVTNIFAEMEDWVPVSEEQVLVRNPDYIVTAAMYFGEGPTPEEEIMSRAGWENVTAVKNGAVLNLANNELSRPTHRLAEGAKMLFAFMYENEE